MDRSARLDSPGCEHLPPRSMTGSPPLTVPQKALYFPNIQGTSLDTRKTVHTTDLFRGRVSIVTVLTARVSEVRPWDLAGGIRLTQTPLRNTPTVSLRMCSKTGKRTPCSATSRYVWHRAPSPRSAAESSADKPPIQPAQVVPPAAVHFRPEARHAKAPLVRVHDRRRRMGRRKSLLASRYLSLLKYSSSAAQGTPRDHQQTRRVHLPRRSGVQDPLGG